ncbi:2-hydroxychromene-2-carboxylate isomerase [Ferrovibrio sp.]|uniref:2-hydroxychromene-2-carboxylate isomerase n=1 Tax=Ferrovibrio sp. TaxID=1917215 RepID=UPI001B7C2D64|nr:2-hydroxychromene-2-carboxylate isomerase [Ferrovibrio sp.]MBP7062600.1 2-hydroxychromene-2-carboxylate isomerase [Ferrovibrio sp.]
MARLEVFYDVSSPWTYLAFHNLQPMAQRLGEPIEWKPILVGGVFNAVNPSVYAMRENPVPAKASYMQKDLQDWARQAGLKIKFPPSVFPVNSVKAMRACIWAESMGKQAALARACFELYWGEDKDISQEIVLAEACARAGLDKAGLQQAVNDAEIKAELKANTDEVISRGGFGSPTIFVDGHDMYFGNDRLALIEAALKAG